jgi:hypothetical protein
VGDERVFIPGEGPGWQMRSGATPVPDTAGGEVVTGNWSGNSAEVLLRYQNCLRISKMKRERMDLPVPITSRRFLYAD